MGEGAAVEDEPRSDASGTGSTAGSADGGGQSSGSFPPVPYT